MILDRACYDIRAVNEPGIQLDYKINVLLHHFFYSLCLVCLYFLIEKISLL